MDEGAFYELCQSPAGTELGISHSDPLHSSDKGDEGSIVIE